MQALAITESLLPNPKPSGTQDQKVLWEASLLAGAFLGFSNFFYSNLTMHDFALTCLSWTGFLLTSIVYRMVQSFRDT